MKTIIIIVAVVLVGFSHSFALAELQYKLSAPLPGGETSTTNLAKYFDYLFPFLLSVAAASALVMFVIGGIQYIGAAGNPSTINSAKDTMTNAILGLLLAVGSALVLQTINPRILNFTLELADLTGDGSGSRRGSGLSDGPGSFRGSGSEEPLSPPTPRAEKTFCDLLPGRRNRCQCNCTPTQKQQCLVTGFPNCFRCKYDAYTEPFCADE